MTENAKRLRRGAGRVLGNAVMFLFSASCVFPAVWLFYSSAKTQAEFAANAISLPAHPSLRHYATILAETQFPLWVLNTLRNTALALTFILLIGFVAGYFLGRFRFKGRNVLYAFFMLGILIPIHALMAPMYVLFNRLGIGNRWFTLVFPYVAFGLPICVFLVESSLQNVPKDIEEAAAIDGSSFSQTLFRIMLPICKPVLVTVGIIEFFACWNEFMFALLLIDDTRLMTISVGLTLFKGPYATDYPKMMSAMTMAILPAMLFYFTFSKQVIQGVVAGAVKG